MGYWTIAELAERAASVLADGDRTQAPSGRVRDVPDARTIRWYQTTGLIDRPSTMRGRTALYGRRHLAQLVAIKRLQGDGKPLAVIQTELAGASDQALEQLARLPEPPETTEQTEPSRRAESPPRQPQATVRARFWTAPPSEPPQTNATVHERSPSDGLIHGVRLDARVLLVLDTDQPLEQRDIDALRTAARPILTELRTRGLVEEEPR